MLNERLRNEILADFVDTLNLHGPASPEVGEYLEWIRPDQTLLDLCRRAIWIQKWMSQGMSGGLS